MKKNHVIIMLLFLLLDLAVAQLPSSSDSEPERTAWNSVYFEVFGNGVFYSLNYDRMIIEPVSVRVGYMYFGFSEGSNFTMIPVMVNYLVYIGQNLNHKIEIGMGPVIGHVRIAADLGFLGNLNGIASGVLEFTGTLAYRYVPADGGVFFKIGMTPFFGRNGALGRMSGGASIGYSF